MIKKGHNKKVFYEVSFVIGMILLFASFYFATKTLIGFSIPILIFLMTGLIIFFIEKDKYNKTYNYTGYGYSFMHLTTSFGGIGLFLFFAINFCIRTDGIKNTKYTIVDRYSSYGGKGERNILHPNFVIDYRNEDKIISFSKEFNNDIKVYKSLELKTSKGLLGFDILLDKKLNK